MKKKIEKQKVMKFSELENKVAVLWMRGVAERQEDNYCSLETQERICKEYAARNGITIKKQYRSVHKSTKTEELHRMIAEVLADREINIILISSFDRLSRSVNEAITTIAHLKSKGVYVISATQPTDPNNPIYGLI